MSKSSGIISTFEFLEKFMNNNQVCIFPKAISSDWNAVKYWTKEGKISLSYLKENFGEAIVPVELRCSSKSVERITMPLKEFISHSLARKATCWYLKDWHFFQQFPEYDAFQLPIFFKFDWLNEYCDHQKDVCDDFRFVYFGHRGTVTCLHFDVMRSYSWSVNVCGKKEWIFIPPAKEELLLDKHGHSLSDITKEEILSEIPDAISIIQETGEAVFVPSGWYHYVENLEDSISINHNWINASNIFLVWNFLRDELDSVKKEVDHLKNEANDWIGHYQKMLKANCGMNYLEFFEMLLFIGNGRKAVYQFLKTEMLQTYLERTHAGDAVKNISSSSTYAVSLSDFCEDSLAKGQQLSSAFLDSLPKSVLQILPEKDKSVNPLIVNMYYICCFELTRICLVLKELHDCEDFQTASSDDMKANGRDFLSSMKDFHVQTTKL